MSAEVGAALRNEYARYLPDLPAATTLDKFFVSLIETAAAVGFVAKADEQTLWLRHILDSLLPLQLGELTPGVGVADLGSGAGLPVAPLAIACPDIKFSAIESHQRRVTFLVDMVERLRLANLAIHAGRVEKWQGARFDVVTMRAFQRPLVGLELALHFLRPGGKVLYWRSQEFELRSPVSRRFNQLGYSSLAFHELDSPPELGRRGLYVLEFSGTVEAGFPRGFNQIKKDKLCIEVA